MAPTAQQRNLSSRLQILSDDSVFWWPGLGLGQVLMHSNGFLSVVKMLQLARSKALGEVQVRQRVTGRLVIEQDTL